MKSPFDWKGEPSIFTKSKVFRADFNGTNQGRSEAQTRMPPRPFYMTSDSVYLDQPKIRAAHEHRPRSKK